MTRRTPPQNAEHPTEAASATQRALPLVLLPLLALIAVTPLIAHGPSCGHDFEFHLQSWLDAASQMRHGTFDPTWTRSAAWNAGEPRFLFYPPLSWMLGAALSLVLPFSAVPAVFTALALCGAAFAMFRLTSEYVSPPASLLASAVYIANPYMLFTSFERTAYGELLAAVWLPLLLAATLRSRPRVLGLAVPIALLWLSNAPAAVIGMYTVTGIALLRIALELLTRNRRLQLAEVSSRTVASLLLRYTAGGALGLALAAFYLLPAAWERRYVQVAMAIIPNMRVEDNFLFGHTGDLPHDRVLHTASLLAVWLLATTIVVLLAAWFSARLRERSALPAEIHRRSTALLLLAMTLTIAFFLTPTSLHVWHKLPELAFLQFPWRLLCLLGTVLGLGLALALRWLPANGLALSISAVAALLFVGAMTAGDIHAFRQPCEVLDQPAVRAQLFRTQHGVGPTDEYTPSDADNDVLRYDDPPYWLASDASAFAPGTVPNPAATIVNYDTPPPVEQTVSRMAPSHLQLNLAAPAILILNLRDYPAWQVTRNSTVITRHLQRDDGLLAITLPSGSSIIDIRWNRTWDQLLGDAISACALLLLAVVLMRSRTIDTDA